MNELAGQTLGGLAPTADRLIIHVSPASPMVVTAVEYDEDEDTFHVMLSDDAGNTIDIPAVPPGEAAAFTVGQEWRLDAALERGA